MTFGNKSRQCKSNPERELDVPGLTVIEPVKVGFTAAVDFRHSCLLKKLYRHDDGFAQELQKREKEIAILMKDCTFSGKDAMSVAILL